MRNIIVNFVRIVHVQRFVILTNLYIYFDMTPIRTYIKKIWLCELLYEI